MQNIKVLVTNLLVLFILGAGVWSVTIGSHELIGHGGYGNSQRHYI